MKCYCVTADLVLTPDEVPMCHRHSCYNVGRSAGVSLLILFKHQIKSQCVTAIIVITPDEVLVCYCCFGFNATRGTTVSLLPLVLTPNEVLQLVVTPDEVPMCHSHSCNDR